MNSFYHIAQAAIDIRVDPDNGMLIDDGEVSPIQWSGFTIDSRHVTTSTCIEMEMELEELVTIGRQCPREGCELQSRRSAQQKQHIKNQLLLLLWLLLRLQGHTSKYGKTRHAGEKGRCYPGGCSGLEGGEKTNRDSLRSLRLSPPNQRIHLVPGCWKRNFNTTLDNGRSVCEQYGRGRQESRGALPEGRIPKDRALMMHTDTKVYCREMRRRLHLNREHRRHSGR